MPEHDNLTRLRHARTALDMAERFFRAEVVRTMAERLNDDVIKSSRYSAQDVAGAANVSRARVYQILDAEKARAKGLAT